MFINPVEQMLAYSDEKDLTAEDRHVCALKLTRPQFTCGKNNTFNFNFGKTRKY